jgi:gamma-glutamyltranspeptidase / glutathione hydrolase
VLTTTGRSGGRPTIFARGAVVSTGHFLATEIGIHILRTGGNAFDAAVASGVALQVTKPHQNGLAGEIPTLLYSADEQRAYALSGHGPAPRAATLTAFRELGIDIIPGDGFLPAIVPPALASYLFLLERFGTMTVAQVLEPAMALAADGFVVSNALHGVIAASAERFRKDWPTSAEVFTLGGAVPAAGTLWRNADLARTLRRLCDAAAGKSRADGIRAAGDVFYRGAIMREIVEFARGFAAPDASGSAHTALLTAEDFAAYEPKLEDPARTSWRDLDILKCATWTQGPVMLQTLNLLEHFDLAAMGYNSADYIHTIAEAIKLAFADREFHYGDPDFADVPLGRLLSKDYAAERARLIDPARASMQLRPGGYAPLDSWSGVGEVNAALAAAAGDGSAHGDTTKLDIIDPHGNAISITTSGGWLQSSPVVPGLGFPLGTRGQMFSLVEGHPNCLAPGKRPRSTLTPTLAMKDGRLAMVFGSPGGDCQDQWALEFLLAHELFGMSLQEATEGPTFWSAHSPNSFYPRSAAPGQLHVEGRIDATVVANLESRGHLVQREADFAGGNTGACKSEPRDDGRPLLSAAASPRLDPAYAAGF